MRKKRNVSIGFSSRFVYAGGLLFLCLTLAACGSAGGRSAPESTFTTVPTWTPTPIAPTSTIPPAPTKTPEPTRMPACSLDETLVELRPLVPYEEFSLLVTRIGDSSSLAVWFVDPALDDVSLPAGLGSGIDRARLDAAELTDLLRNASPCIDQLIDKINPIVVDSSYTGWISVEIPVRDVPSETEMAEGRTRYIADNFLEGFLIESPPDSFTAGSCDWPEAQSRLWDHFSRERQNVAFYFVVDRNGPNVWAQWDGPTDPVLMSMSLGNIILALECFSPDANLIFIIVDEEANVGLVGYVPQMDFDQLQILYGG